MNVYVVILFQTFLGGATHIVAKSVTEDVDALTLTFLRSVVSCVGLIALLWVRGVTVRIAREDWRQLSLLGFLGISNQLLYMYGIHYTTAANGALLYASTPVFVLIFSRIFLAESITVKKTVGIALAFIGVATVIFERGISLSSAHTYGNLIVLAAVLCWGLFTVFGKSMAVKYGALRSTSVAAFLGGLMLFPFGIFGASRFHFQSMTEMDWLGVFYLGIGTSIVSYLLWYYALRRIEASRLAVFSNGQPIVAALLAFFFLQYTFTGVFLVGGTVTVAGVILTQLK
ncbi:MAG TPA: DMT family transporter [Bacteroidota bacterium]|nr:DMT family transporter [Bacteroidota bacterium]